MKFNEKANEEMIRVFRELFDKYHKSMLREAFRRGELHSKHQTTNEIHNKRDTGRTDKTN